MPRFLLETSHEPVPDACLRVLDAFIDHGSHYLTHADWGCDDGVHKAWVLVEADSKQEARTMLPPAARTDALVVEVRKFTADQIRELHASIHSGTAKPENL